MLICVQYNTVIFESSVGMDHNTALLVAGFNGVAYFFSAMVPIWVIDRYVLHPNNTNGTNNNGSDWVVANSCSSPPPANVPAWPSWPGQCGMAATMPV